VEAASNASTSSESELAPFLLHRPVQRPVQQRWLARRHAPAPGPVHYAGTRQGIFAYLSLTSTATPTRSTLPSGITF
jgi:hypothetical protein